MCIAGTNYVPIAEAAQLLETTEMRILMMLKKNELQGTMVEDSWFVDRSSLNICDKPKAADVVRPGGCGGGCGSGSGGGCGGH
jgi:hypothetical protein